MAGTSSQFWGPGPHFLYHGLGQDVVVGVYDLGTGEEISGCFVKTFASYVEVLLPLGSGTAYGYRIVVVG